MKEIWEQRYSKSEYVYGKEANVYFKSIINRLRPGRILCISEGEGRNAIYAAMNGWQVYATDFSENAKLKALKLAAENSVTIDYEVCPIQNYYFRDHYFDVIALIYSHFDLQTREELYQKIKTALTPNGCIIIEMFNPLQVANSTGGPKDIQLLPEISEFEKHFTDFEFLELKEDVINLDEGSLHQGKSNVIRAFARKKTD